MSLIIRRHSSANQQYLNSPRHSRKNIARSSLKVQYDPHRRTFSPFLSLSIFLFCVSAYITRDHSRIKTSRECPWNTGCIFQLLFLWWSGPLQAPPCVIIFIQPVRFLTLRGSVYQLVGCNGPYWRCGGDVECSMSRFVPWNIYHWQKKIHCRSSGVPLESHGTSVSAHRQVVIDVANH